MNEQEIREHYAQKAEEEIERLKNPPKAQPPTKLGIAGYPPEVKVGKIDPNLPRVEKVLTEQEKYTKMWTVDDYRKVSPGEQAAHTFFGVAHPEQGSTVTDFGTGTGRGAFSLFVLGKMKVTALDFAANCLDQDVANTVNRYDNFSFEQHDLTKPIEKEATEYGYCTDVMEHIPTDDVDLVLYNILKASRKVFFRISTQPDVMGPKYLKQHLHLTVRDYAWWSERFAAHGATILYSEDLNGQAADFYVTCWHKDLPSEVKINTESEQIVDNIIANASFPGKHVRPHQAQSQEIVMLCGGPSLNDFTDEIKAAHAKGTPIVTVNNAYNWAHEQGIMNVTQCMLDAREFNKRFIGEVRDDCMYFMGSQCHPSVLEGLPPERTFLWHCTTSKEAIAAISEHYPEFVLCGGGSTVTLRAIILMHMLGFRNMTLYGFDSCLSVDGDHHAYPQPENDSKLDHVPVMVGDRTFYCQPWMAYQAVEFGEMTKALGNSINITVRGDGLIAHMIETGGEPPQIEET